MNDKLTKILSWIIPLLCAVAALYALTFPLQDPDTFWHLAYGRAMVEQGRFINHEIFSYTAAGKYLGSHSQLAQVLLYLVWLAGESHALLGFKLLVGLTTFVLVVRTAQLFDLGRSVASVLALLVILAGISRFVERPELFSILLQGLLILLLLGYTRGRFSARALWALPVMLVLWDYLQGALFGLVILLTLNLAETLKFTLVPRLRLLAGWSPQLLPLERLKPLWLWSGITLLAMALHPNGLLNYAGFWRVASSSAEFAMYGEFMPPRLIPQFFWFWVCLGLVLALGLLCLRRLDLTAFVLVLPFLYLGLKYNRASLVFALAAVPLLAHCLTTLDAQMLTVRWWRGAALVLMVALFLAVPFYKESFAPEFLRFGVGINENAFPVGSTRFIADVGLSGNMFNTDGAAGYLAFFLSPERKIFNYNQPGVFNALTEYVHKPESRSRWDIRYALVDDAKGYAMFLRDGFVPVYREANAMVMVKPSPEQVALIEKYKIRYFEPLKPVAELEALSKKSWVAPRLCEEISIYLTYRRDARMAELLGKLLRMTNPDVQVTIEQRRAWLEAALRENQGSLSLLQALGGVVYQQGDLTRAATYFDDVLAQNPTNVEVLLSRGYIDYDRKNYREALEYFTRAVGLAQNEGGPHYALGLAAMRLGDKDLMKREFQQFLLLAPDSPFAEKARKFLAEGSR